MCTRREAIRRVGEEVANERVLPQGNQAPPNEQVPLGGQVSFNTPILTDGEIRDAFQNLTEVMATQSQVITTKAQAIMVRADREIGTPVNKIYSTMDSHLRDFSRVNPPMLGLS